jgi:YD repeat-containing protein
MVDVVFSIMHWNGLMNSNLYKKKSIHEKILFFVNFLFIFFICIFNAKADDPPVYPASFVHVAPVCDVSKSCDEWCAFRLATVWAGDNISTSNYAIVDVKKQLFYCVDTVGNNSNGPSSARNMFTVCPLGYPRYTSDDTGDLCGCTDNYAYFEDVQNCVYVKWTPAPFDVNKAEGKCSVCSVGNPIEPGTGGKYQTEVDYISSDGELSASRIYNGNPYNPNSSEVHRFGKRWNQGYGETKIFYISDALLSNCWHRLDNWQIFCTLQPKKNMPSSNVLISRSDGKFFMFTYSGEGWVASGDVSDKIFAKSDAQGNLIGWQYISGSGNDEIENYDANGKLLWIKSRAGIYRYLTYSDGATNNTGVSRFPSDAPACVHIQEGKTLVAGLLLCVTDSFGRQLQFEYDEKNRLTKLIDPKGDSYLYEYDGISGGCTTPGSTTPACIADNLTSVTFPDGTKKVYWYNEKNLIAGGQHCSGNLLNQLTGITDENGSRFASWNYDCQGMAKSSEHAGGVDKVALSYGDQDSLGSRSVQITYYSGAQGNLKADTSTRQYANILGVPKYISVDQPCADCGSISARAYDSQGNVSSSTDFNGITTTYTYDLTRNLETSHVEASGTPQARTTTTTWHSTYRLPLQIAEPKRITTFAYDANGNLLSKSVQASTDATGASGLSATTTGPIRTWSYTYTSLGQMLTATGPTKDLTSYSYDDHGNLTSVTNAAGHVTNLSNYDANGRVGRITDPNGLITDLTYTPRGWLSSRTVGGQVTNFGYDGVGQLTQVTFPDTSTINYVYDDAHRLTSVADSLGNSIAYTLDNMGNRTGETVVDPTGALARQTNRVYDALNRLQQQTGGVQ